MRVIGCSPVSGVEIDMRRLMIAAAVLGGLAVTACNTVEGAGKDVGSAGKAVAKDADKAK